MAIKIHTKERVSWGGCLGMEVAEHLLGGEHMAGTIHRALPGTGTRTHWGNTLSSRPEISDPDLPCCGSGSVRIRNYLQDPDP